MPLTKTVSKGKGLRGGGEGEAACTTLRGGLPAWEGGMAPAAGGQGQAPGFVPCPRVECLLACARATRVSGQRAVLEKNPCCFRPCRVFDHYILAFNSLLLFIDFDNYSGLWKKKNQQFFPAGSRVTYVPVHPWSKGKLLGHLDGFIRDFELVHDVSSVRIGHSLSFPFCSLSCKGSHVPTHMRGVPVPGLWRVRPLSASSQ